MKPIANQPMTCASQPLLSSQTQGWDNILVEEFHHPAGEGTLLYPKDHLLCLSLAPRPVRLLHIQGDKSYEGLYGKGDLSIAPAATPSFARWDHDDRLLQIRIDAQFLAQVATEVLALNTDRLEVIPTFHTQDPELEAIALMLRSELKPDHSSSNLYIESLTNVLAVHLIRQFTTTQSHLPIYKGGLPQRQLSQVLDYINDNLEQDIKLADLASLLGISPFHFSHLFKQSIEISPYQYLLQQRIERAKQLLKQTNHSIMDIALTCGFSSHSHLSKQFRQTTGITPKGYRANI
jgi:AraC family transcriptional regulator